MFASGPTLSHMAWQNPSQSWSNGAVLIDTLTGWRVNGTDGTTVLFGSTEA